jgi:hypothetical protein
LRRPNNSTIPAILSNDSDNPTIHHINSMLSPAPPAVTITEPALL